MRDLRLVNYALLETMKIDVTCSGFRVLRDILIVRYGDISIFYHNGSRTRGFRSSLFWWKELCFLGTKEECSSD